MKRIIRNLLINVFSLYLVSQIVSGIVFQKGLETLLLAGSGLTLALLLAKPIINLLLLPINLITFGLFRWVASAITLYIVTLLVPTFKITGFNFSGFTSKWVDIPVLKFQGVFAFVAISLLLSLIISFIHWLNK